MVERRNFLKLSGLAAGLSASSIARALALPGNHKTGSLEDVQHIVVLMQENRSFDHYFGTLRGVRGHNDRFPLRLANGQPVWCQPRQDQPDAIMLPFHLDTSSTAAQAVHSLNHSWDKTQAAFNGGRNNAWPANKTDLTMGHYTRQDIPFHYALADAFTVCDHYFSSIPGATHPNRMFLMTGTNDPSGRGGGPLMDNVDIVDDPNLPPFTWSTYPERLQQAGISWQVYQQGLDRKDPVNGNYGLNVLMNFKQFIEAPEGSPLRERGYSVRRLTQFAEDVRTGKLPQVSWLMPPAAFSEHPKYMPAYGATYIAEVLDALTADPAIWAKTVLLVMYDENDGYFDHIMPPQPPTPVLPGESTVSTAGEIHEISNHGHTPFFHPDQLPYGLGSRVPMMAISPWSKGGYVNSEVFDHTSVIRFIEARFGVGEPNISPWRRAVCGDLTSAFDFSRPPAKPARLMSTADFRQKADEEISHFPPPRAPADNNTLAAQEPGTRPFRPLPYKLTADFTDKAGKIELALNNFGTTGVCFYLYQQGSDALPWRYTVGAGHSLIASLPKSASGFILHGPNGFYRAWQTGNAGVDLTATSLADHRLQLTISTQGAAKISIRDNAYGHPEQTLSVAAADTRTVIYDLTASHHWYDLTITASEGYWHLAGHIETGQPSLTDPAATKPVTV